jgi:hypothetical protein
MCCAAVLHMRVSYHMRHVSLKHQALVYVSAALVGASVDIIDRPK